MPNVTDYYLFTAADQPASVLSGRNEFETRLVHGLLLEPGLVLPDTYFFSSAGLLKHVFKKPGEVSLFELALEKGLVVPALRQPASSFTEVITYLREQQLQGQYDELDDLASRLSQFQKLDTDRILWPNQVGVSYEKLIELCLRGPEPSGVDSQIWKLTENLRADAITKALRITKERSEGDGLRRGELYRAVGSILGVLDLEDSRVVGRAKILMRYAAKVGKSSIQYRAAKEFFDWIDEIHRTNTARSLGVRSSIFASSSDTLAVLQTAMPSPGKNSQQQQQPSSDGIDHVIRIPSVERLLQGDPRALLEVRDYGVDWRTAATRFITKPNDQTRHSAEKALESYEKQLQKFAPRARSQLSIKAVAAKAPPSLVGMAGTLLPVIAFHANPIAPVISTCVAATVVPGYFTYKYFSNRRKNREAKVRVRLPSAVNVIQPDGS
jgi:hypothetical protein